MTDCAPVDGPAQGRRAPRGSRPGADHRRAPGRGDRRRGSGRSRSASRPSRSQAMPIEVPLRGRTKAKSVVSVMPETAGTVDAVHVEKGQTRRQGRSALHARRRHPCRCRGAGPGGRRTGAGGPRRGAARLRHQQGAAREGPRRGQHRQPLESQLSTAQAGVAAAAAGLDNAKAELEPHRGRRLGRRRGAGSAGHGGLDARPAGALRDHRPARSDAVRRLRAGSPHRPRQARPRRRRSRRSPATRSTAR